MVRLAQQSEPPTSRRDYLNSKFGRTGNLNRDINYRGNKETASNFFKSKGYIKSDAESYMNGFDFNKPTYIETIGPGKNMWQYQSPGAPQGNWYSPTSRVKPTELGINPMGTNRAANTIEPKVLNTYKSTQKIETLRGRAAPVEDFWSVKGQPYTARGGARQIFTDNKAALKSITPGAK